MNEREKQIEEMAKVIEKTEKFAAHCGYPSPRMTATDLYCAGCRIVPEDAIILTRAEIDALNEYSEKINKLGAKDAKEV